MTKKAKKALCAFAAVLVLVGIVVLAAVIDFSEGRFPIVSSFAVAAWLLLYVRFRIRIWREYRRALSSVPEDIPY